MTATITLFPEYAALVRAGVKWIETRPGPSHGPGKVPGLSVEPGDRLLIHAGMRLPAFGTEIGQYRIEDGLDDDIGVTNYSNPHSDQSQWFTLHFGHIVASAVLRDCVPIVDDPDSVGDAACVEHSDVGLIYWREGENDEYADTLIDDQLPLGDFTPGRWAWLLDDVKPTTERCPACWGEYGGAGGATFKHCPVCFDGTCPPIPAKGRQGIWRWEP